MWTTTNLKQRAPNNLSLSNTLSLRELEKTDAVNCCCRLAEVVQPEYVKVSSDDDDDGTEETIHNHLYTLLRNDMDTMLPRQWLNDSEINAGQKLLLQNFPHVQGLQPPTLQQVSGFHVHQGEFVQIVFINNDHWCVVSNIGCDQGKVNVYDTFHTEVQASVVPIVTSLIFSLLPTLKINMVDVGRQKNTWDCRVLAVAIAYDLCAGNDPSTIDYDHTAIQHLVTCCSISQFPSFGRRLSKGVTQSKQVNLYSTCRMPEKPADDPDPDLMAECDHCKQWFHQHCVEVFAETDVPWCCPNCRMGF